MKKIVFSLMLLTSVAYAQQTPTEAVTAFFKSFHAKDTLSLRKMFVPDMSLHSISERQSGPVLSSDSVKEMLIGIATIPKGVAFEERLGTVTEKQDGSMAHVWAPYEFYINGKFSHKGVNSFMMFNDNGQWKITYLIDTRRR